MKVGLLDSEKDDEHNSISSEEICEVFATQDAVFFGTKPFDRVFKCPLYAHRNTLPVTKSY